MIGVDSFQKSSEGVASNSDASDLEVHRFRVVSAASFLRSAESLADEPGIYCLLMRGAGPILTASGYSGQLPCMIGDFVHMYSGSSFELGKRVSAHLIGTVQRSNFRETLHAIDTFNSGVVRKLISCDELSDGALTMWIAKNALVAYRRCTDPKSEERTLLMNVASPLNIVARRPDPYARRLVAMRCAASDTPVPRHCWKAAEDLFVNLTNTGDTRN